MHASVVGRADATRGTEPPGGAPPVAAEMRLPPGGPVHLVRAWQPAGAFSAPPAPEIAVHMLLNASGPGYADLGASRGWVEMRRGLVCIAPPDTTCHFEPTRKFEVLVLCLQAHDALAPLREPSSGRVADLGPMHEHCLPADPVMEAVMLRLWNESAAGNPMGPLYAEAAAVTLATRLTHLALGGRSARNVAPLAGRRLGRVLALIEDEIGGDLTLGVLAKAAGLSPFHFSRAFKAATGLAPHGFVLLRRVARAQRSIRQAPSRPLVEIAAACGFAHHSHLTAAFRRAAGTTPAVWRGHQRSA